MRRFLLILLMLISANALAGLSKWVDAEGKVHYSDQAPPPDVQATKLRISSGASTPASAPAAAKTIAEREAELRKAQQAKKEAAETAAREQERMEAEKAYCAAAQQNLRALQQGLRMVEINANGERSYLSDGQRQQRIEKVQRDIETHCK